MTLGQFGLEFHHFGLATRDAERAVAFLLGMGYKAGKQIHDPLQEVQLTWCEHAAMPAVEVVSPSQNAGPLDGILKTRGELTYHLCYSADNIEASVEAIAGDGHRVITVASLKPAVLFDNRQVAFYLVRGFGLIEIVERP